MAPPEINNYYKTQENPFGLSLSKPAAWPFDMLRANGGVEFIVKNLISGGVLDILISWACKIFYMS